MNGSLSVLAYGDRALLLELGETRRVVVWTDALGHARLPGVVDLVPAAETLLVVLHERADVAAVRSALLALEVGESGGAEEEGELVTIPVTYDGPDLGDVARLTGLTAEQVVEAHTGTTWRVAFGGFAPGFGDQVGGDPRREGPRREESRTRVPAGAVGLAGTFSGVYPRESPGGWQLIGTTSAPMWDLDREPPALLVPGARVRFEVAAS